MRLCLTWEFVDNPVAYHWCWAKIAIRACSSRAPAGQTLSFLWCNMYILSSWSSSCLLRCVVSIFVYCYEVVGECQNCLSMTLLSVDSQYCLNRSIVFGCGFPYCSWLDGLQKNLVIASWDATKSKINLVPWEKGTAILVSCIEISTLGHRASKSDGRAWAYSDQVWTDSYEKILHGFPDRFQARIAIFCGPFLSDYCTGSPPFYSFPLTGYNIPSIEPW